MKTPRILMMAAVMIFTIAQWAMAGPQRVVGFGSSCICFFPGGQ